MAQHDFDIANQSAPNFRQDLNNALEALNTLSSGTNDPSGDINNSANMLWYDTANNTLKMRTEADNDWIILFTLDQTGNTTNIARDSADTDLANDPDAALRRDIGKAYVDGLAFGSGQIWQDLTANRASSTTYQNTSGKGIFVQVATSGAALLAYLESGTAPGSLIRVSQQSGGSTVVISTCSAFIPNNGYYRYTGQIGTWVELR